MNAGNPLPPPPPEGGGDVAGGPVIGGLVMIGVGVYPIKFMNAWINEMNSKRPPTTQTT